MERRVTDLQRIVSEMNQTFIEYNDKAMSSGIIDSNPNIGLHLKATMERFSSLAQTAETGSDSEEIRQSPSRTHQNTEDTEKFMAVSSIASQHSQESMWTEDAPNSNRNMMLGYEMSFESPDQVDEDIEQNLEQARHRDKQPFNSPRTERMDKQRDLQQYRVEVPDGPIFTPQWNAAADSKLKTVMTYSFQERTFARRLYRTSCEYACRVAHNPLASPQEVQRLFRISLCYGNLNTIKARMATVVRKSSKDSLENWAAPLWHIGGAGLHFPRTSLDGDSLPPDNWASTQSMGPYRPGNPAMGITAREFPEYLPERQNVQGVWFDANDVEHYLRHKGIFLDGAMNTAEIEVEEPLPCHVGYSVTGSPVSLSSDNMTNRDTLTNPPSPNSQKTHFGQNVDYLPEMQNMTGMPNVQPSVFNTSIIDSDGSMTWPAGTGYKDDGCFDMDQTPMFSDISLFSYTTRTRKLNIDVERLLESKLTQGRDRGLCVLTLSVVLNEKAICLGRAPGYRQEDVDIAFNRVVQEAY